MKTNLYSFADSIYIINHYRDILIGKEIGSSKKLEISEIDKIEYEKNKYRVICKFKIVYGNIAPFHSIENVLEELKLPQPNEILKNQIK